MLATILVKVKAKTVAKTLQHVQVEALVHTLSDTLSDKVPKKILHTLTCVYLIWRLRHLSRCYMMRYKKIEVERFVTHRVK